jgi:hypothetical protein
MKKIKSKLQLHIISHSPDSLKLKIDSNNIKEDVRQSELPFTAGKNVNWDSHLELFHHIY